MDKLNGLGKFKLVSYEIRYKRSKQIIQTSDRKSTCNLYWFGFDDRRYSSIQNVFYRYSYGNNYLKYARNVVNPEPEFTPDIIDRLKTKIKNNQL